MFGVHYLFTRCARGFLARWQVPLQYSGLIFLCIHSFVYTTVCPLDALAALC